MIYRIIELVIDSRYALHEYPIESINWAMNKLRIINDIQCHG